MPPGHSANEVKKKSRLGKERAMRSTHHGRGGRITPMYKEAGSLGWIRELGEGRGHGQMNGERKSDKEILPFV